MIYLNVWLTVTERTDIQVVESLLTQAAELSRAEPGCARFEVYHSTADESRFLLNEHWENQAAIDEHRKGVPYTQIYQPQILPRVTREGHPCTLVSA
jgi:quinol monooxygenase YgiN